MFSVIEVSFFDLNIEIIQIKNQFFSLKNTKLAKINSNKVKV
jgi:hypothetical protein